MMDGMTIADEFDAAAPDEPSVPTTLDIEFEPIEFQKKTFATLHLREPTSGETQQALSEIQHVSNPYTQHRMATRLVSAVSKVPIEVILKLPESVIKRAMIFFERIGDAGPPTGPN